MLKLRDDKKDDFLSDKTSKEIEKAYRDLPYEWRRKIESYGVSYPSNSTNRYFLETYEEVMSISVFSNFPIRIILDSHLSPEFLPQSSYKEPYTITRFWILEVNGKKIFVTNLEDYFEKKDNKDYTNIDLALLSNPATIDIEATDGDLSLKLTGETHNSVANKKNEIYEQQKILADEINKAKNENHNALAEIKAKFDAIKKEMEEKKEVLMQELKIKELELKEKSLALEKEISVLDAKIYDIRSYFGESYELIQVRSGKEAPLDEPFVISQKVRFLNEDLPILIGMFNEDIGKASHILDALKYSDKLVDYFCQTDKSIMFFRLSRNNTVNEGYEHVRVDKEFSRGHNADFYIKRIMAERGHSFVGFLVKNGENLYLGSVDEGKRVIVQEDIFMDINGPDNEKNFASTSGREKIARKFIFSLIQGLIDNKRVVKFKDKVNIFTLPSEIIFSSAFGAISSNQYGTFPNLKSKLNQFTRTGDNIYILDSTNDLERLTQHFENYKPSMRINQGLSVMADVLNGEKNKTFHVLAKREKIRSEGSANSKAVIKLDEFINIEYLNSKWVEYFISNKDTDKTTMMAQNFYELVKHLMVMRDYLIKRENVEESLILKYYPDLNKVENWQIKLSEWKLQQKSLVKNITDYQAKRFAKALTENTIKSLPNLYSDDILSPIEEVNFFRNPKTQLTEEYRALTKKMFSYNPSEPLKNVSTRKYFYYSDDYLADFVKVHGDDYPNRKIEKEAFYKRVTDLYEKSFVQVNKAIKETLNELCNEMDTLKTKYGLIFYQNNETIANILNPVVKNRTNLESLSNYQLQIIAETLKKLQDTIEDEYDERTFRDICVPIGNTSRNNVNMLNNANPEKIYFTHKFSDRYYPSIIEIDKETFVKELPGITLTILSKIYRDAMDELNNYPYYRKL